MSFFLFDTNSQLLPAFCKPYPDELFSSWMTRMAYDHGLNLSDFCRMTGITGLKNKELDAYISEEMLKQLALKTNMSYQEVKETTLLYYIDKIFERINPHNDADRWILQRRLGKGKIGEAGLMFCPQCLSVTNQQPYFKREWKLAISFVCPTCKCYLLESCPHCNKKISLFAKSITHPIVKNASEYIVSCVYCHRHIGDCESTAAPDNQLALQKQLYDIFTQVADNQFMYPFTYFKVLYYLCNLLIKGVTGLKMLREKKLAPLLRSVYEVHTIPLLDTYKWEGTIESMCVAERAQVLQMAHWLLSDWPGRFLTLCTRHGVCSRDILPSFKDPPFWFLSPIIQQLPPPYKLFKNEMPFGLKSIFEKPRYRSSQTEKAKKAKQKRMGYVDTIHVQPKKPYKYGRKKELWNI